MKSETNINKMVDQWIQNIGEPYQEGHVVSKHSIVSNQYQTTDSDNPYRDSSMRLSNFKIYQDSSGQNSTEEIKMNEQSS